ncbi:unnamed protein product [marine sediment metagenome]|uniref:Uncharacterized protein n=1 Tax=marine sediment metagenome TaxID=412755 RepID=X0ZSW2_9ZZZZ
MAEKDLRCVKRNALGECIEWVEIADKFVPVFRENDKKCNPELYEKWKDKVKGRKISILPED